MRKILLSTITAILVLIGSNSFAQVFISIDGIEGESMLKDMKNAFEAESLSWGASSPSTFSTATGGATAGKVKMEEMVFTKQRGKASNALQMGVFSGKHFPKVEVRYYKAGADMLRAGPYLTFILEDVIISSWKISSSGSERPMESFSINFARVKFEEVFTNPDGSPARVKGGWDIMKNVPIQW